MIIDALTVPILENPRPEANLEKLDMFSEI